MTPAEADALATSAAAYVHVPFCARVCPYCDFAVVAGRDDLAHRYIDAVCRQIRTAGPWRPLDAIYVGGGTPSHLDASLLGRIIDCLADVHGIASDVELTVEANPEDVSTGMARELRSQGFNRLSLGVQSFDAGVLGYLGRRHDGVRARSAIESAREAGFESVSVDLIFGSPVEDDESWAASLEQALMAAPDHVSCYALTVEPGTALGRRVAAGEEAPNPDVQATRYETADSMLTSSGLLRYEVSNWAKPGHECRYNLTVWAQGEYEGYGNGAHGHREGTRYRNYRRIDSYMEAVESGKSAIAGAEKVKAWDREIDRLFVGLRRSVGVKDGPGVRALMRSRAGLRLIDAGVLAERSGRLVVDRPLLTDEVLRAVLDLEGQAEHAVVDNVSVTAHG